MSEKTVKKMPVVKLKVGEIIPNVRRSHTIAEMNNLRSHFGNYSHHRVEANERNLPALSANHHDFSRPDNTIYFVLRGKSGSRPSKSVQSQTSKCSRSPVSSSPPKSPLFKRTFRFQKSQELGLVDSTSVLPQQMNDYEVRGSSLLRENMKDAESIRINEPKTPASNPKPSISPTPRPSSYLNSRQYTSVHSRDYSAFDRGEGYLDEALITKTPKTARKVYFEETKKISNIRYLQDHTKHSQTKKQDVACKISVEPLQLTIKNLEMFDYLSLEKKDKASEQNGHRGSHPHSRVLTWVQSTPPIVGIPEEPNNGYKHSKDIPKLMFNVTEWYYLLSFICFLYVLRWS